MAKILLALLAVGVAVAVWWNCKCCHPPNPPNLSPDEWWGPKEMKGKVDNTIKPFQIKFEAELIKDLQERLKKRRPVPAPLEGVGFEYGFNSMNIDTWANYWADQYPFAQREKFFNQFPQFKTNIQGLNIHFIRVKPQVPANVEVLPLILMHGWPGSFREFYEVIPLLTKQASGYNFAFEVIVPSLPGYGFSDAAVRPGLDAIRVSVIMRNLMQRLGFKKYYVQGGDWGSLVASSMATLFPDEVLGYHSNMLFVQNSCSMMKTLLGTVFPSLVVESHLADRMYPLSKTFAYAMEEFGYMHLQSTKPDTVGTGLTDSPTGLLTYILEKFATWTVKEHKMLKDGGLTKKFTKDQLIDNLMVYWSTSSITTSMRLYAETMSQKTRDLQMDSIPTKVPTWGIQAKHELFYQPPGMLKSKYPNLINTTVLEDGGHFLAFELPQVFAEDVFRAVKAFREFNAKKTKTEL